MKKIYTLLILLVGLGAIFAQQGSELPGPTQSKPASLEKQYLDAIDANPKNAQAYWGLLKLYKASGKEDSLIKIALKAIQYLGDDPELYAIIGDTYKDKGDFSKSLSYYQMALKISPISSGLYNRMGLTLLKMENYHQAEVAFKAAIFFVGNENNVAKGRYYNNLGVSFEARQDHEMAAVFFKKALKLDPSHPYALSNLQRIENSLSQNTPQ
ncbi:MAG: hypothetical protein A2014_06365 [Spirochaetes bacterium GWF1_49_6]|jgi:tetratricopeptide (TPR) repeat protein|nr:MAG: hypothetical protein A2014_06365 [Spirochaetes bacterium GWF1_49_6]